nr:unnamed protein product [Callosobruchus chinensis]
MNTLTGENVTADIFNIFIDASMYGLAYAKATGCSNSCYSVTHDRTDKRTSIKAISSDRKLTSSKCWTMKYRIGLDMPKLKVSSSRLEDVNSLLKVICHFPDIFRFCTKARELCLFAKSIVTIIGAAKLKNKKKTKLIKISPCGMKSSEFIEKDFDVSNDFEESKKQKHKVHIVSFCGSLRKCEKQNVPGLERLEQTFPREKKLAADNDVQCRLPFIGGSKEIKEFGYYG